MRFSQNLSIERQPLVSVLSCLFSTGVKRLERSIIMNHENSYKILIIDGNNLLFRMFYGIPNEILNSDGIAIQGVVGFIGSILKMIRNMWPTHLICVFDSEIPSKKYEDTDYKKNRIMNFADVPDKKNPFTQLPYIKACLEYMNIQYIEKPGYEADDVIATLCKSYRHDVNEIIIVSTDKDYFQLIDTIVHVIIPGRKNVLIYDSDALRARYGIVPSQYILFRAITGDKSDNISGISGIGEKTAQKILHNEIRDCDALFNSLDFLKSNLSKKILEHKSLIKRNFSLISMDANVDIQINLDIAKIDVKKLTEYKTMALIEEVRKNGKLSS